MVRRMDRDGEALILVQKMLGLCERENGSKIEELLQAGASGHQRAWQDVETWCREYRGPSDAAQLAQKTSLRGFSRTQLINLS